MANTYAYSPLFKVGLVFSSGQLVVPTYVVDLSAET